MLRPGLVIIGLWVLFWISWLAAAKGTIPGLLGAILVTLLDPGAYDDYRRKVPMLVPFGPR